jgi:hypothetical protein
MSDSGLVLEIGLGRTGPICAHHTSYQMESDQESLIFLGHIVLVRSVKTMTQPDSKLRRAFVRSCRPKPDSYIHIKLKYYNHVKPITY